MEIVDEVNEFMAVGVGCVCLFDELARALKPLQSYLLTLLAAGPTGALWFLILGHYLKGAPYPD